jgi:ATP-dependent DNA helicase RecG
MDSTTLINLIDRLRNQRHENAVVEFKSNWDKPEDIGQYISALANTAVLDGKDRAWMIWGIEDQTHVVRSTRFDPSAAKGEGNQPLVMWLTQKTSPRADFSFHEVEHPEGRVVVLEIHPSRGGQSDGCLAAWARR